MTGPRWVWGALDLTDYPFAVVTNSADHGTPANVVEAMAFLLADGELELTSRRSNREVAFTLLVEGADLDDLARNEQALMAEADKPRSTFTFYPGDNIGEPTVFDTFRAEVVEQRSDDFDAALMRQYAVTMRAHPFPRSLDPVEVSALPVGTGTTSSVDDGSSATAWSIAESAVTRTNLMPNGTFETSLAGWSAGSGSSGIGGGTPPPGIPTYTLQVTTNSTAARSYANSPKMPVTAGLPYAVQMQMRTPTASGHREGVLVRYYNSSGVSFLDRALTTGATENTWIRRAWVDTAPAGAVEVSLHPFYERVGGGNLTAGLVWEIAAVMVEQSATVGDSYFNGATTDTATVTYNWTGTAHNSASTALYAQSVAVASGAVQATRYGDTKVTLRRTGAVTVGTYRYLRLNGTVAWDVAAPKFTGLSLAFTLDGATVAPTLLTVSASGVWSAVLPVSANFTTLGAKVTGTDATIIDKGIRVAVDQVTLADTPVAGTGRQSQRIIPVYGSMRTEASVKVLGLDTAGTAAVALGSQTLVYTSKAVGGSAFSPSLRQYRTAGPAVTLDTTTVSGATETMATAVGTATTFTIPAELLTEGSHALYAKLSSATAGTYTVNWQSTTATAFSSHTETGSGTVTLAASTPAIVEVDTLTLPTTAILPGTDADVTLKVWVTSGTVTLDEAWAFNISVGQVSLVDTSGGVQMVRIDPATVDRPEPSYWVGSALTDVNTIHAGSRARGFTQHMFEPGEVALFVVTMSATTPRPSLWYYPRWHTHAAQVTAA